MRSAPTVVCELRRSRIELALVALLTAAAFCAPLLSPLPLWVRLVLMALALACGGLAWRTSVRRNYVRMAVTGDGRVQLVSGEGVEEALEFHDAVLLGPLLVLELRREQGPRLRLPLYRDSLDPGAWRRLRVLLRHGLHDTPTAPVIR